MRRFATYWDVWLLLLFLCTGIIAPFLANQYTILCAGPDGISLPFLSESGTAASPSPHCQNGWHWRALIGYSPNEIDRTASGMPPGTPGGTNGWRYIHWMGTDMLGRDVASGLLHGTRIACIIGFLSVFIAFVMGVSAGMAAAYSRKNAVRVSIVQLFLILAGSFLLWFYGISQWAAWPASAANHTITFFLLPLWWFTCIKMPMLSRYSIRIPLDAILLKLLELRKALPGLLLILVMSALLSSPSVTGLSFLIALLTWTEFARYARAETLQVMEENYIVSLQLMGLPTLLLFRKHILPNILPTLAVAASYSIASAILLESSLSFLGIGLPVEQVTWGKMMAEGRNMQHWWLVVFPGICLFLLLIALNRMADRWQKTDDGALS